MFKKQKGYNVMKIYFTASIVGKKQFKTNYETIITELKDQGHIVISDHILKTTEEQLSMETSEERRSFHKRLESWIATSDCMIVEASFPSISVGFEISLALSKGKAVLVLLNNCDPPSLLPDLNTDRLVIEKYTLNSLPHVLHDFLLYAEGSNETRFTFFLTHDQASYLSEVSRKAGVPKSVYLRNLIDQNRKLS